MCFARLAGEQVEHLGPSGLRASYGDRRCLIWGLAAEETVKALRADWQLDRPPSSPLAP